MNKVLRFWKAIVLLLIITIWLQTVGLQSAQTEAPNQGAGLLPECRIYPGGSTDPGKPTLILLRGWNTDATISPNGETSQIDKWWSLRDDILDLYSGVVYFSYNRNGETYSPEDTYQSIYTHHRPLLRDLIQSCVNKGYTKFDLIGHSLGGVVAMEYIKLYGLSQGPGSIEHVVTLDSPVNGGEQAYRMAFLPGSLSDVFKNALVVTLGKFLSGIQSGSQNSLAEVTAMYEDRANTLKLNTNAVPLLLKRGTRISNFTNEDDIVVLLSDAMIPGAFGRSFQLGNDFPSQDFGHGRIFNTRNYPEVLPALRSELQTLPPPTPTPSSGKNPAKSSSTSTVLLLDISGSMGTAWRGGVKMESAKNAASDVVAMMEQENQQGGAVHNVGIATFSSGAWLDQPLTTSYAQVQSIITGLMPTNGTNMGAGLEVANQALQASNADDGKVMILLSDGLVNEGMNSSMILSGPVQDAVNAGTCIYTIGFGEPGDLDEDLLRRIAGASGCGEYYYASDAYQLGNIYIRLRHESTGEVIAEIEGEVAQGGTTPPEPIQVPASKEELNITLSWPGSALDLIVTDPKGKPVDMLYQGASLVTYGRFVYLIVKNPPPGIWNLSVFGKDVPEGIIDYDAIASVRGQRVIPPPRFEDQSITIIAVTFMAALLLALFALAMRRSSGGGRSSPGKGGAGVAVRQGHGPSGWIGFRRGVLGIGRDPRNELTLHDDEVSRMHAQIRQEHGQYVIYDLNSSNGTKVNGKAITKIPLNSGDEIIVGNTVLIFNSSN